MEISTLLLKNKIGKLENELISFQGEMKDRISIASADILDSVERSRNKIDKLKSKVEEPREALDEVTLALFHGLQKELNMDLKLMRRKLKRNLVNQSKLEKKLLGREADVATVAA